MTQFIEHILYKSPMSWWIFVGSGVMALLMAWLTISFKSIRAARRNPVETLRYE